MEKLDNLIQKIKELLGAIVSFKEKVDVEGFSIEKISLLVPSILAFIKILPEVKEIKEELKDLLENDSKIKELVDLLLVLKNAIKDLINAFDKDDEAVQKLLKALD